MNEKPAETHIGRKIPKQTSSRLNWITEKNRLGTKEKFRSIQYVFGKDSLHIVRIEWKKMALVVAVMPAVQSPLYRIFFITFVIRTLL